MADCVGRQLGDYRLTECIGSGGMGSVYLARHEHLRKQYAVKVMAAELGGDESFIARFHDEARVMAELRHEHIVQVHHMGSQDGLYYLVMDYVTGENDRPRTLQDVLNEAPGDDTAEYVRLASVAYPNGQHTTHYNYATDVVGAPLNRIQNISSDSAGTNAYAQYTYLGAGTIVEVDSPQVTGGLTLSYIGAAQGDYSGFDQFGRIVWQEWSGDAGTFQYGYDRGSNITFRADRTQSRLTGQDQAYQHDDLGRLTEFRRGVVQAPDEGFLAPLPADFNQDGKVDLGDL